MASLYKLTNLSTTQGRKVREAQMGLDKRQGKPLHIFRKRGFVVWWEVRGTRLEGERSAGRKGHRC